MFWKWSTHTVAERELRQRRRPNSELLASRLLSLLARRRRRIFERWRVWAAHSAQLAAGEERAVIAGQSWRAARVFHGWHEWARCSSVSADLLRFRQHQCLGCWRAAAVARCARRERIAETCVWRSTRLLQTSIDKLWMFAAQQQRLSHIAVQVAQLHECCVLERSLSSWRHVTLVAVEKRQAKILARAFWRENVRPTRSSLPISIVCNERDGSD